MASSTLPDWRGLLLPLAGPSIAGHDLRDISSHDSIYWLTKDLRTDARRHERELAFAADILADKRNAKSQLVWQQVADNAADILKNHSKDLDVATWLIEAWSRLYGIQGIAAGLVFFAAFLREFWWHAYPTDVQCDHPRERVCGFSGLNGDTRQGTLIDAIYGLHITNAGHTGCYALWHYINASNAQFIPNIPQREQRLGALGFALPDIQCSADASSADFYRQSLSALYEAQQHLLDIDTELAQRLAEDAPATTMIRDALDCFADALTTVGANHISAQVAITTDHQPGAVADVISVCTDEIAYQPVAVFPVSCDNFSNATVQAQIQNRRDAIVQLGHIASFFRHTEPHSPLSYGIEKLMRWAQMPFSELMQELITDTSSRTQFHLMTGIDLEEHQ